VAKINHLILHEISREKDGEAFKKVIRQTENSLTGVTAEFAESLGSLFTKSNLNIGEFAVGGNTSVKPPFEQFIEDHYTTSDLSCTNFVDLTKEMANMFPVLVETEGKQNVKGGLFVFYEYELQGKVWLAIAILERSDGYNAKDNNLDLEPSKVIDLRKLYLGATVNLTDWSSGSSSRYIRFKAGLAKGNRDYFENFIGCQRDKSIPKKETRSLKSSISSFSSKELNLDADKQQEKLDLAHAYIKSRQDEGTDIELSSLAKHVFPENDEDFVVYTTQHYDLGETISIDNQTLRSFKRISGKNKDVSISFSRDLLKKKVHYNAGKLTFDVIPDALKQAIEKELN